MLRATLLSLVLAIGGTLAGLYVFHIILADPTADQPDIRLAADSFDIVLGSGSVVDGRLRMELADADSALLVSLLSVPAIEQYPYLVLNFSDIDPAMSVSLGWTANAGRRPPGRVELPTRARHSIWLETAEIAEWNGPIDTLGVVIKGELGDSFTLQNVELLNYSLPRQVRSILQDWSGFDPWRRASMNSYTGVNKLSPFYPVFIVVCILALGLAAYCTWALLFRRRSGIDWRVTGLIFLCCWFILDLIWQHKLLRQVAETHATFAYKTTDEKLRVGPDAELYTFISAAKTRINDPDARVFIASTDEYTGLRASYYLYPQNVFWVLRGAELPYLKYTRPGDYIVIARPSNIKVSHKAGLLVTDKRRIPVDVVHHSSIGTLVRLQ